MEVKRPFLEGLETPGEPIDSKWTGLKTCRFDLLPRWWWDREGQMEVGNSGREIRRSSILKGTEKTKRWRIWKHQKNQQKQQKVKKQSEMCYEVDVFPNMFFLNEVYINMILNSFLELLVEFLTQNTVLGKRFVKNHQLHHPFGPSIRDDSQFGAMYTSRHLRVEVWSTLVLFRGKKVGWRLKPSNQPPPKKIQPTWTSQPGEMVHSDRDRADRTAHWRCQPVKVRHSLVGDEVLCTAFASVLLLGKIPS